MQAALTPEFLNVVPASIRERLKLKPGVVLDFDELAPFLKAVPAQAATDDGVLAEFQTWLANSTGLAKGKFTTNERMRETRGDD
jgi:bifunctional DNA-binding transcriptional regulator/antitoxin component of YhaV-PrlF toxin-antitoxin module